jgi:hypothetical protein
MALSPRTKILVSGLFAVIAWSRGTRAVVADRGLLQIDLAFGIDGNDQRLVGVAEGLGLGLGQVDGNADGQQRRRHHEDDQQHQHHIDHRRDVDLRHRPELGAPRAAAVAPVAASPAARKPAIYRFSSSWARGWRRTPRRRPRGDCRSG